MPFPSQQPGQNQVQALKLPKLRIDSLYLPPQ